MDFSIDEERDGKFSKALKLVTLRGVIQSLEVQLLQIRRINDKDGSIEEEDRVLNGLDLMVSSKEEEDKLIKEMIDLKGKQVLLMEDPDVLQMAIEFEKCMLDTGGLCLAEVARNTNFVADTENEPQGEVQCLFPIDVAPVSPPEFTGKHKFFYPTPVTESSDVKKERLSKTLEETPVLPQLTGSEEFEEKEEKILNKLLHESLMGEIRTLERTAEMEKVTTDAEEEEEDEEKVKLPCSLIRLFRKLYGRLGAMLLRRTKK